MRIIYLSLFIAFFSKACFAGDTLPPKLPASSFSFELGGTGVIYSVSYERILLRGNPTLTGRVGLNPLPFVIKGFQDMGTLGGLAEISLLTGRKRNFLEVGSGVGYNYFIDPHDETGFTGLTLLVPHIGYRGYSKDMRTYFKLAYTPLIIISKTSTISRDGNGYYTDEHYDPTVMPVFLGLSIGRTLRPR